MLKVLFGDRLENTILNVDDYFRDVYEFDWFTEEDPFITSMVKEIDDSELRGMAVISPYLGSVGVEYLSGGVKSLIMYYKMENFRTDLIVFGDNCEDYIMEIAKNKDIEASMTGMDMRFWGKDNIKAYSLNECREINGYIDWCKQLRKYIGA